MAFLLFHGARTKSEIARNDMLEPNSKTGSVCMHCNGPIKDGVAYVSAGALFLTESQENSIQHDCQRAFMNVGFHGSQSDMSDSADVEVVNDLPGGQFDLSFCSLICLKSWFVEIVDRLHSSLPK